MTGIKTIRLKVLEADGILNSMFEGECLEYGLDPSKIMVEFDIEGMVITSYILIEPSETVQDLGNRDNSPAHIEINEEIFKQLNQE